MPGNIILLRGPSGVGKSTIAMLLRERCAPAIRLDIDALRYLTSPRLLTNEHLQLAELGGLDMLLRYARSGFNVICDSVFQDDGTLSLVIENTIPHLIPLYIFSLHMECDELLQRNRDRDYFSRMEDQRIVELYENFNWTPGMTIETGGRLPEEIVDVMLTFITEDQRDITHRDTSSRLIFVRHGQAESSQHIYPQHDAMSLSLKGLAQARNLAFEFQNLQVSRVISSSFPRAMQTAQEIVRVTGADLVQDDRWKERTFTSLYGMSWQNIIQIVGKEKADCIRYDTDNAELEGEEHFADARKRVEEAFNLLNFNNEEHIIVVSDGGPHSWLCAYLLQVPSHQLRHFYISKAHVSSFLFDENKCFKRIEVLNGKSPVI